MAFKATDKTDYGTQTFHEDPDRPGTYVIQKTIDPTPILDRAALIRNEIDQRGQPLRLEMSIPITLFYEWMRTGKLAPEDYKEMPGGGIVIDPKKLAALKREMSLLSCT